MDKITIEHGEYKLEPVNYWVSSRPITPYWFWQKWFPKYEHFAISGFVSFGPFSTADEAHQFLAELHNG